MVNKIADEYECPFDILMLKFIDSHLDLYYALGFTPNMITTIGIIFGLLSMHNIFNHNFRLASFLLLCAYYFDCVDGKLARKYNLQTDFGDYYDHFGDLFKIIIILYALYKTNPQDFNEIKLIIIILILLMFVHLGYQEKIYDRDESPTLNFTRYFANLDTKSNQTIHHTKLFGCGTFIIILMAIVYNWKK